MKISEELTKRGFIYQCSCEEVGEVLDAEKRTVYLGIDPTADSIHVGNLVPYMLLNHLLRAGHRVVLLIGGGTALIGDPGGKSEERPFVDEATVVAQATKMESGVRRFVDEGIEFVNNHDWLKKLSMIEFLRDVGKHFTVNSMIKKDIVANRLIDESSISYTEFSYSLLQAYDYYHLNVEKGCDLQIGGSDQWSNIVAGVDFIRRKTGKTVYGLTMPLVVDKATGRKFGKSEGNAIWLDAEKTSPFAFYQFWLNTSDESVIDYLKLFTFLSLEEVEHVAEEFEKNPGARSAQQLLAKEVTAFVHGGSITESVARASEALFSGADVTHLTKEELEMVSESAPVCTVEEGTLLLEALLEAKLATSKREARTFIESGAVSINGHKQTKETLSLTTAEFGDSLLLRRGKRAVVLLNFR